MARTDTLPHFLTDVADAIRTKGGTVADIQASSFDTAIANLPSGGTDWTELGYTGEPDCFGDIFDYDKNIKDTWNASITSCYQKYAANYSVVYFPVVDTSNVTTMQSMFDTAMALQKVPTLDTKKVTSFYYFCKNCRSLREVGDIETTHNNSVEFYQAFQTCTSLEIAPMIKTAGAVSMYGIFQSCSALKDVPQWQISGTISQMSNAFSGCTSLTSTSLNNIMGCIANAAAFSGTKKLSSIGFTSGQATTCTGLSNWDSLVEQGWTTGY